MKFGVVVLAADPNARERLARTFRQAGFRVTCHHPAAPRALVLDEPHLVVLDAGSNPIGMLSDLRLMTAALGLPVMVVLAQASEPMELMCFNAGAREVVQRTASPAVLVARAHAMLPSSAEVPALGILRVGPLTLDRDARALRCGEQFLHLRRAETSVLEALMTRPRHVVERASLKRIGWGEECSDTALDCTISRVRSAVLRAGGPRIIIPLRGVGYRLGLA
jgi:DNA-binding response OmpR family regulator